jgi:two-component system chemotaxis response regulator CheB
MDVIEVFIVMEDGPRRSFLSSIINEAPGLKLVSIASNGVKTLKLLPHALPNVLIVSQEIASKNNFELINRIMTTTPIPIIVIASDRDGLEKGLKAVEKGALEVILFEKKPPPNFKQDLLESIKTIAEVKLITRSSLRGEKLKKVEIAPKESTKSIEAVAIGASLGGPPALAEVLLHLPSTFPVPIFIVQHISLGFVKGFADWLQEFSQLKVVIGKNNEKPSKGYVYIAPDNAHMELSKEGLIKLIERKDSMELCPSVARLFKSLGDVYQGNLIAIILTGMGKDGAEELLSLKKMGAYTIAQDQESSIMFSMPKAAIDLKAVCEILPLSEIGDKIIKLTMANV